MSDTVYLFWGKILLIVAMILGSDPVSEPVINKAVSFAKFK